VADLFQSQGGPAASTKSFLSRAKSGLPSTGFFDSIGRKQRFKLRHYRKAPSKAIAAAPERPASENAM
jgi:hypothetical protein